MTPLERMHLVAFLLPTAVPVGDTVSAAPTRKTAGHLAKPYACHSDMSRLL
jgi:hypothetical protein